MKVHIAMTSLTHWFLTEYTSGPSAIWNNEPSEDDELDLKLGHCVPGVLAAIGHGLNPNWWDLSILGSV